MLLQYLRINERDVIAESVGGEVLVINLNSGAYFSSDGTGEAIWTLLVSGRSTDEVITALRDGSDALREQIEQEVGAFVQELVTEGLLVSAEGSDAPSSGAHGDAVAAKASTYSKPVLKKYTDMQELLLLDPIHEVDASVGWPIAKPTKEPRV